MPERLDDIADERRAIEVYEQIAELDPAEREQRTESEPASVRAILAQLYMAEATAAARFSTSFIVQPPEVEPPRPTMVGLFRLLELIGVGGMAEVWRAERADGLFEQIVAVKLIRPGLLGPPAIARFDAERRLLARIDHPAIARIIDGGVSADGRWPYFAMEFVDGEPIDQWTGHRQTSLVGRVDLLIEVCAAIDAAHARGIAHADIKPDNILVTAAGNVRLIDLGIAHALGAEPIDALRPMTWGYASPERLAGASPSVGDDIHALGTVMTKLVPPSEQDADLAAIIRHTRVGGRFAKYPDVACLLHDLHQWRAKRPVKVKGTAWSYRAERIFARHRRLCLGALLAVGVVLALIGVIVAGRLEARHGAAVRAMHEADLLGITHYLMFDLDEQVARQPRSLALRAAMVSRAQTYLDRLSALPEASASTRLQSAAGLQRLATEQDHPGSASLGQPRAALRNLAKARRLIEPLSGEPAALAAIGLELDQARLNLFATGDIGLAARQLDEVDHRLAAVGVSGVIYRGPELLLLAQLRGWQSRFDEETTTARSALRLRQPLTSPDAALFVASALDTIADGQFWRGDVAAAERSYVDERAVLLHARQVWPGNKSVVMALVRATWSLGSTILERGRGPEAAALLAVGLGEVEPLIRFDPRDDEAARLRNIIADARAQAVVKAGRRLEGVRQIEAGVKRWQNAWRSDPNPIRLRDYAIAVGVAGGLRANLGDLAIACTDYRLARSLLADAARQRVLTPFDAQTTLAQIRAGEQRSCSPAG